MKVSQRLDEWTVYLLELAAGLLADLPVALAFMSSTFLWVGAAPLVDTALDKRDENREMWREFFGLASSEES